MNACGLHTANRETVPEKRRTDYFSLVTRIKCVGIPSCVRRVYAVLAANTENRHHVILPDQ